jgi:LysM domain
MPDVQAPPVTPYYRDHSSSGGGGGGDSSSQAPASGGTGAGHDTRFYGNPQGRDPDLLFAGEKIMINGKQVTVANGDTLSSLAAQHGTTVEKLIAENKMDASLLGQNGPNGAYYTSNALQPPPGGWTTVAPKGTATAFDPAQPAGPNGTYTKDQATVLARDVQQLINDKKITEDVGKKALDLLNKLISDPENFKHDQMAALNDVLKEIKSQSSSNSSTSDGTSGLPTPEEAAGMLRGTKSQATGHHPPPDDFKNSDFSRLRGLLKQVAAGDTLSSEQQQELTSLLARWTPSIEPAD